MSYDSNCFTFFHCFVDDRSHFYVFRRESFSLKCKTNKNYSGYQELITLTRGLRFNSRILNHVMYCCTHTTSFSLYESVYRRLYKATRRADFEIATEGFFKYGQITVVAASTGALSSVGFGRCWWPTEKSVLETGLIG